MPFKKGKQNGVPFKPGYDQRRNSGGRPRIGGQLVGGRAYAVRILDNVLAKAENREKIESAFQDAIDSDAIGFFRSVVMPLLPRSTETTLTKSLGLAELSIKQLRTIAGGAELEPGEDRPVLDIEAEDASDAAQTGTTAHEAARNGDETKENRP
ncbi:MAG: hypothetical protein O3A51_02905 [Verrucomicrobia bacterium]|nr:hypothetical protein [Verrucomicrobiota bacterium]